MSTLGLELDRQLPLPLSEQIVDQIQHRVRQGTLPAGQRLPSTRVLAKSLGVSRNTVVAAFELLLQEGWVESGVGRGTFVAERGRDDGPATRRSPPPDPGGPFRWEEILARGYPKPVNITASTPRRAGRSEPPVQLAGAVMRADSFPSESLRRIFQEVLAREGPRALCYAPAAGFLPLREYIAAEASTPYRSFAAEEVLIVNGAQQGLDLIARLLLRPAQEVVVEAPSYANALAIWSLHGAHIHAVPLDGRGIRPAPFADSLRRRRPRFAYLMPTFQNPTGLSMDLERRLEILEIAQREQTPIVEVHFDAELRYSGTPCPTLASLDPRGQVILVGTFSKMLCPGLRLGWIIAPAAVRERLLDIKRTCDLATNLPAQMAVAEFCRRGELHRHLEEVRARHTEQLESMLAAIDRHFPAGVEVTRPEGGTTLWATLPGGHGSSALATEAAERGVLLAPGGWFFAERRDPPGFRLSFVAENAERIEKGIATLGRLIEEQLRRAPLAAAEEPESGAFVRDLAAARGDVRPGRFARSDLPSTRPSP